MSFVFLFFQEAILKLMCAVMKGYRQFLLPITEAPNVGTADPSSLFSIQGDQVLFCRDSVLFALYFSNLRY